MFDDQYTSKECLYDDDEEYIGPLARIGGYEYELDTSMTMFYSNGEWGYRSCHGSIYIPVNALVTMAFKYAMKHPGCIDDNILEYEVIKEMYNPKRQLRSDHIETIYRTIQGYMDDRTIHLQEEHPDIVNMTIDIYEHNPDIPLYDIIRAVNERWNTDKDDILLMNKAGNYYIDKSYLRLTDKLIDIDMEHIIKWIEDNDSYDTMHKNEQRDGNNTITRHA